MKRIAFIFLGVFVFLGLRAMPETSAQTAEQERQIGLPDKPAATRKVALIIGNGAYANIKKLRNPANDAADIAASLKELGFEIIGDGAGLNLTQREMKQRIREFGQRLRNGGVGVFYYAGHGVQLEGRNYLLPIDLAIESEADLEDSAVDLQFVFNNLRDANNGLNIVILDACRNNPFESATRDARDGLAEVRAATGTLIAYATAPGSVAADGAGRNGTYTSALLKQLKKPGLEVLDMFRRTREDVFNVSKKKQVPWTNESLIGRFCFAGCEAAAAPKPPPAPATDAAFELEYWNAIKDSSDPEEYRGYLAKYPNGQFADIARRRAAGGRGGNGTAGRSMPEPRAKPTPAPTPAATPLATPKPTPPPAVITKMPTSQPTNASSVVVLGVINERAVSLPKPSYPVIALAVRAAGEVEVLVTIDEEGNVIKAVAITGHVLLREAAVEAAKKAKFDPTQANGNLVKITGTIVYNFTPPDPQQPDQQISLSHLVHQKKCRPGKSPMECEGLSLTATRRKIDYFPQTKR
jgi:TonB family protein